MGRASRERIELGGEVAMRWKIIRDTIGSLIGIALVAGMLVLTILAL